MNGPHPRNDPTLPDRSGESFAGLGLPPALVRELAHQGISAPFAIQAATLPDGLAGRDVLARGRTGSGKTLAFGLAVLARSRGQRGSTRRPLVLVLVPTRELAQQVTESLTPYARSLRLRVVSVVGGRSISGQARALRAGAEVVVATPGRLADLVERGDCRLDRITVTVLDEADQMANLGFLPQITALLDRVPPGGQYLLFSATLDRDVDELVDRYLTDPVVHEVHPSADALAATEHRLLDVAAADKRAVVTEIAARGERVLLFLETRHVVDELTQHLLDSGVLAAALHGGRSQAQRSRTLEDFKAGRVTALVATNVAARGIHVDDLGLVVNVDPPGHHKDYLHRGGRTARAGAPGTVVTLVLPQQRRAVVQLLEQAGITAETGAGAA
ncbi:Superfamily II DNA and RNA helicase [Streptacidiphilus jiangxiensis]|uniref:Superfamily II DNA and RNA helicase n=1 Tax=Streptacidiphilus jiangxiensis TaxID=235985 RepID=A0A1H7ZVV1_STRJI|nr:DEAD/DEAH box helicase [Streptacidiphilus jiangxiensis]SEM62590.1 Superfamily II DNA and RNA helicase [Streptacidiphilus jiangxiensis]